ncbi:MAG: molybdopterin molybdotransferase MoeA [Candidatus Nezhaarchaeales archaeon]
MKSGAFKYVRLEEALKSIDLHVTSTLPTEDVMISDAYGRFLAEDVISKVDLPPYDITHFDGYALRSCDVLHASPKNPIKLKIKSKVFPSTSEVAYVGEGEAIYVATGSPMPLGADGVLPVEAAIVKGDYIEVKYAVKPGDHVIKAGSDVKRGDLVLKRGHRLRGQDLAMLALMGLAKVRVTSRPKVCVISVGDELVDYHEEPKPGRVPCSHALMVSSFVLRDGGLPMHFKVVPDDISAITETVSRATNCCDVVITIGGASKGERDLVHEAVSKIEGASMLFHGIMIRPGRQTGFAMIKKKPLVMLPGLPHSTIVGYQLIARRVIFKLMGLDVTDHPVKARMACDLKLPPPRGFKRVVFTKLEEHKDCYLAWPLMGESALLSIAVKADGYAIFDEGLDRIKEGSIVNVYLLY